MTNFIRFDDHLMLLRWNQFTVHRNRHVPKFFAVTLQNFQINIEGDNCIDFFLLSFTQPCV